MLLARRSGDRKYVVLWGGKLSGYNDCYWPNGLGSKVCSFVGTNSSVGIVTGPG
jgi:hypothetical protein